MVGLLYFMLYFYLFFTNISVMFDHLIQYLIRHPLDTPTLHILLQLHKKQLLQPRSLNSLIQSTKQVSKTLSPNHKVYNILNNLTIFEWIVGIFEGI